MNKRQSITVGVQSAVITLSIICIIFWIISFGPTVLDVFGLWFWSLPMVLVIGIAGGWFSQWVQFGLSAAFVRVVVVVSVTFGIAMVPLTLDLLTNDLSILENLIINNIASGIIVTVISVTTELLIIISIIVIYEILRRFQK